MPERYPPGFRRTVLDLVASGARSARWFFDLDLTHTSPYRLLQGRALDVLADVHHARGDDRNARDTAPRGWPSIAAPATACAHALLDPTSLLVSGRSGRRST